MASIRDRIRHAWNAFADEPTFVPEPFSYSGYSGMRPNRRNFRLANERSIIASIYTRLAIDVAAISIRHTRHDEFDRYKSDIRSGLNDCLTVEANIDQAARAFRQDIALTLFDKGVAVIVPVDTTLDPSQSGGFDIRSLRVGDVCEWYPYHVRVNLYNERKGRREEIVLEKKFVAIIENPLYGVMNEINSTLQRLIRKLALLDSVDEASSSGKLDMIIQLPYVIKSEARRQQAEQRRADIEFQLKGSQYGVAYTDGTEKITQLNRPVENNLLDQIKTLTDQLYTELGLTPEVMNGTANEATMLNYNNRTLEPIVDAIVEAMRRTFLTKTARSQGQSIDYFRDVFKLVPLSDVAEISDKLTRNEILTSNEIRQAIGYAPSTDPKADQLVNSNMPQADTGVPPGQTAAPVTDATQPVDTTAPEDTGPDMAQSFDSIDDAMKKSFDSLGIEPPPSMLAHADPPSTPPDPGVMLAAFAQLDKLVDGAFSGLG